MARDIMVIDYHKCIRVPREDYAWARPTRPHRCPVCATSGGNLTPQSVSARLVFGKDRPPFCEDHDVPVQMVPVR